MFAPIWLSLPAVPAAVRQLNVVTAIAAVATLVLDPAITSILGEPAPLPADLSRWQSDTIDANVLFLVVAGLVVVSAALGVTSVVQARITRAEARALRTQSGRV
ncbi:MAG: hypothetical protein E2584_01095 [Microbacterium sp.]|nr:hypothetical protein [Microbacterium sp.]